MASGLIELVAVVMLLAPRTVTIGALLSVAVMSGAILSHLTKLGIVVKDDGGLLFGLAISVLVCSLGVLVIRRRQIPILGYLFLPAHAMSCETTGCQH